ncbi:hypothetical protein Tco_0748165 [Tanacetum coccineum]|uniref:Uncharacterized protein n=1 Tax=Tanacetum coccineum TaxID=301880 RepID=A0ABQ4YUU4_9ASTR
MLLYHDWVRNPVVVVYFPYDFCFHKFGNFLLDCFVHVRCMSSSFLPYGLTSFVDIQAMFHYGPWNACHVCRFPGKYVQIATLIPFVAVGSWGGGPLGAPVTILHSAGIKVLLRIVTIPPSTWNLSISWAVDGTAKIFLRPGRPMIPLYGDGDLTTMKFIVVLVECSPSPKDTISDIFPQRPGYLAAKS